MDPAKANPFDPPIAPVPLDYATPVRRAPQPLFRTALTFCLAACITWVVVGWAVALLDCAFHGPPSGNAWAVAIVVTALTAILPVMLGILWASLTLARRFTHYRLVRSRGNAAACGVAYLALLVVLGVSFGMLGLSGTINSGTAAIVVLASGILVLVAMPRWLMKGDAP